VRFHSPSLFCSRIHGIFQSHVQTSPSLRLASQNTQEHLAQNNSTDKPASIRSYPSKSDISHPSSSLHSSYPLPFPQTLNHRSILKLNPRHALSTTPPAPFPHLSSFVSRSIPVLVRRFWFPGGSDGKSFCLDLYFGGKGFRTG
jgi:hypothetical protein